MSDDEYVLGTDDIELERLGFQHGVWAEQARSIWKAAGFDRAGRYADLGCGPGYTSLDLAAFAGPGAEVLAIDESERFVGALTRFAEQRGARIEPMVARVEALDLPEASLDGVYARWLFCWLADPVEALARVARALRPGGRIALQEYLHWGTFALLPHEPSLDAAVRACLASWDDVHINAGALAGRMAERAGLEIEHFEPIARMGAPGSEEWRWLEGFHRSYLPRLAERGLLTEAEAAEALEAWDRRGADPRSRVLAPTMSSLVLRRP